MAFKPPEPLQRCFRYENRSLVGEQHLTRHGGNGAEGEWGGRSGPIDMGIPDSKRLFYPVEHQSDHCG